MTQQQLKRLCGNLGQVYGVTESIRQDGKAAGTKELRVTTGGGLEYTVNATRGLDIPQLRFMGRNIGFLAKPGVCNVRGVPFQDSAFVGFLTTCGLCNCGPGSDTQPLHGKLGTIPATQVCGRAGDDGITVSGTVEESSLFGVNFSFKREIFSKPFENFLRITDVIENNTENAAPYFLLYHFNFGWPFLDEDVQLKLPGHTVCPRDDEARAGAADYAVMHKPVDNYREQVFFLDNMEAVDGKVSCQIINPRLGIGVEIVYENALLPNFIMWKSMKSGDYALGMEPSNNRIKGHLNETSAFSIPPYGQVKLELSARFFCDYD